MNALKALATKTVERFTKSKAEQLIEPLNKSLDDFRRMNAECVPAAEVKKFTDEIARKNNNTRATFTIRYGSTSTLESYNAVKHIGFCYFHDGSVFASQIFDRDNKPVDNCENFNWTTTDKKVGNSNFIGHSFAKIVVLDQSDNSYICLPFTYVPQCTRDVKPSNAKPSNAKPNVSNVTTAAGGAARKKAKSTKRATSNKEGKKGKKTPKRTSKSKSKK